MFFTLLVMSLKERIKQALSKHRSFYQNQSDGLF